METKKKVKKRKEKEGGVETVADERGGYRGSISRAALAADFHGRPTVWRKNVYA